MTGHPIAVVTILIYASMISRTVKGQTMKKIDLAGWAAVAEIIGTVAIVISLLFVGYSINRNTVVLQAANENFIAQLTDDITSDLLGNSDILSIIVKIRNDQELSDHEKVSMSVLLQRMFNHWELSYYRHAQGLFSRQSWNSLNKANSQTLIKSGSFACTEECWADKKSTFGDEFVKHVDAEYAKN